MKSETQTQPGAVAEESCLVLYAATERLGLMNEPDDLLKGNLILRVEHPGSFQLRMEAVEGEEQKIALDTKADFCFAGVG